MPWVALALLCGLNLLNYLDRYVMSGVLTPLQRDLRLSNADAGWAASAFMLGYFISAPLFGWVGDRFKRKIPLMVGVAVWSLATAGSGLAHSFAQLFAIRIFVGFGEACFVSLGPTWISDLFGKPMRNTAITFFYTAIPFGSALGFMLGGWFAGQGVWREAFFVAGLPGLLFALALLLLREPKRGEQDGGAVHISPARFRDGLRLLENGRYNLLVWGYTAQTFAMGAFGFWGAAFLERVHGFPTGSAATIFGAILAGTGLVATLIGGLIGTHLRKKTDRGFVWLMALSMVAALPVCGFALLTGNAELSVIGLGLSMFLLFLPTGPITSEMFEIVPVELRATSVAMCVFVQHLFGDFGSPTIVGYVADKTGSLQKGVLILPFVLMIGAVLWCLLLWRPAGREKS